MSRPQYDYYQAQPQARGPVVNGGLIDFHDSGLLQRGVQEYAVASNQPYMMAAGYPSPGQPGSLMMGQAPTPSMLMAGAYQPQPGYQAVAPGGQALASQPVYQPAAPGGQPLASQPVYQAVTPGGGQAYISGPPSFLHMNGVTYKPVEDHPTAGAAMMQPDPRVKASTESAPAATEPAIRTLSEDEFHQAIREHVESKVESYMSKQDKLHQRQPQQQARSVQPAGSSKQTHRIASKRGGHVDEEQAAANRVQAVNASMRSQSKPAAWQACVNRW